MINWTSKKVSKHSKVFGPYLEVIIMTSLLNQNKSKYVMLTSKVEFSKAKLYYGKLAGLNLINISHKLWDVLVNWIQALIICVLDVDFILGLLEQG